jgi:hypothetical protein
MLQPDICSALMHWPALLLAWTLFKGSRHTAFCKPKAAGCTGHMLAVVDCRACTLCHTVTCLHS